MCRGAALEIAAQLGRGCAEWELLGLDVRYAGLLPPLVRVEAVFAHGKGYLEYWLKPGKVIEIAGKFPYSRPCIVERIDIFPEGAFVRRVGIEEDGDVCIGN